MRYSLNRNELARIYCESFPLNLAGEHARDSSNDRPTFKRLCALWPVFLHSMVLMDVIDLDACEEWSEAPPKGEILSALGELAEWSLL